MSRAATLGEARTPPVWRQRRWVLGHLICLALITVFVNCGLWQLSRLHDRRERNDLQAARMTAAAQPLDRVVAAVGPDLAGATYRRVSVTGEWLADGTLLVRSRSFNQRPGYHVLGIVATGPGRGVVVNRGFAPVGGGGEDTIRASLTARGPVRLTGIVRPSEVRGSIGPKDPSTGRLTVLNRVDVARIQRQTDLTLAPVFVQLSSVSPEPPLPEILPLPDTSDDGPHLDYAGQWFLFALIGAVGWPFVVRRALRADRGEIVDAPDET